MKTVETKDLTVGIVFHPTLLHFLFHNSIALTTTSTSSISKNNRIAGMGVFDLRETTILCTVCFFHMQSPAIIKKVTVRDKMQKGYTYNITEPEGKNFHPVFKPQLTPADMLELGVFGGRYMTDCIKEFPAHWFEKAKLYKGPSPTGDKDLNYFKVEASQPLSVWKKKGWIHPQDPRGWFQWYCRYYMGRRSEDDLRQIGRWKAMVRHIAQIKKGCKPGDTGCRRRQRQALLHWAYDSLNL